MDRPLMENPKIYTNFREESKVTVYGDDRFSEPTCCPNCGENTLLITGENGTPIELSFGQKGRTVCLHDLAIRLCPHCKKIIAKDEFFEKACGLVEVCSTYPIE